MGEAPDLPFEAFEKLDGSLIIAFHHAGRWRAATKGCFDSEQAIWAQAKLDAADLSALEPGTTYLFEAVYPGNRIVAHMVSHAGSLPRDNEGFVIRFGDGLRLKLKGAEYRRIHALVSRCTPLAMWEAMAAGDDMGAIRRDLPEEFWTDFDDIVGLLTARVTDIETRGRRSPPLWRICLIRSWGCRSTISLQMCGPICSASVSLGPSRAGSARPSCGRYARPAIRLRGMCHPTLWDVCSMTRRRDWGCSTGVRHKLSPPLGNWRSVSAR